MRKLIVALTLTLPAAAIAQDAGGAEEAKPVTRIELSNRLDADYASLDADEDGKVTPAEINSRLVKSAEAQIAKYKKDIEATFAKMDSNGDGSISKDEFMTRAKMPTIKEPDAKPFLDRFDANKDGSITKDEFRAPTMSNFEQLDKNRDGSLTEAEIKIAAQAATSAAASTAPKKKPTFKDTPAVGR